MSYKRQKNKQANKQTETQRARPFEDKRGQRLELCMPENKECQGPPEAGRGKEKFSLRGFRGGGTLLTL